MISTKKLLYKVVQALSVDYVTEEGEKTGGWYYRKWKSGKVECWMRYVSSSQIAGSAWTSPIYYHDITLTIPDGIFTTAPLCVYITSATEQWWVAGLLTLSASQVKFRVCKPTSTAQTAKVSMYLVKM